MSAAALTALRQELTIEADDPARSPIEIDVECAGEGRELVDCLSRHGFVARLATAADQWQVEVRSPFETPRRLLVDLLLPLELWLREHPRPVLVVRVVEIRP
jgi:hypothetical protein